MAQGRLTSSNYSKEWPELLQRAVLQAPLQTNTDDKPLLIRMQGSGAFQKLEELLKNKPIMRVIDNYDEQFAELVVSRHPQLYKASLEVKRESLKEYIKEHYGGKKPWNTGTWAYFPWKGELVHILEEELFLESRTIRNKNLLTPDEQQKFQEYSVACAGMSVGSNVALALALTGGAGRIKLADSAVISASNLNRIVAGVSDVGEVKSQVVMRRLFEMNPYLSIERHKEDVSKETIDAFFEQPWPVRAVVDEIDDLKMKILLRIEARKRAVPVIMATDLGDDVMLDVERFDVDTSLPLFHGLAGPIEDLLDREVGKQEWLAYAMKIIGPKNVPLRLQQSLMKVGTGLVTQPQLGSTALLSGVAASYAIRKLALGEPLKSGRMFVSLDASFSREVASFAYKRELRKHTKQLEEALASMQ